MALSRKFRLSGPEIKKVFKNGSDLNSELFQLKFLPIASAAAKFAIIVGSKVSKKASVRNKIRRKFSEIIRLNISKIRPGYLILIVAKPKLASTKIDNLGRELMELMNKIGQLK